MNKGKYIKLKVTGTVTTKNNAIEVPIPFPENIKGRPTRVWENITEILIERGYIKYSDVFSYVLWKKDLKIAHLFDKDMNQDKINKIKRALDSIEEAANNGSGHTIQTD